jgi:hypothetical protein
MPKIIISDQARRLIYAARDQSFGWTETGSSRPDGRWEIPVASETVARLDRIRFMGESDDEVILRLLGHGASKLQ